MTVRGTLLWVLEANNNLWFLGLPLRFGSPGLRRKMVRRIDDTAIIANDGAHLFLRLVLTLSPRIRLSIMSLVSQPGLPSAG